MQTSNTPRMTLLQAIRILKQTAAPRRTRVLIEQILPLLTNQEFDMLKEAIELERLERTYSGEDQQAVELSEVKIEIKTVPYKSVKHGVRNRPYIYIRWRDRSHEDLYLGAMLSPVEGISLMNLVLKKSKGKHCLRSKIYTQSFLHQQAVPELITSLPV